MITYRVSKKEYTVASPEALLEAIKNENSHTMELTLQEYMDNVAARVINGMTAYKVPSPANAEAIVEAWKKLNILEEVQ